MSRGKPRYTDKFRTDAVLMLEAAGYPHKTGALTRTSEHLDVPARTLSRWFKKEQNPPPGEMVREKRGDLIDLIRAELNSIIGEMEEAREGASYRDLATAFGILTDKLQLLSGEPTENSNQRIVIERHGISTIPQHLARQPETHTPRA